MNQVLDHFEISHAGTGRLLISKVKGAELNDLYLSIAPPNDNDTVEEQLRAIYHCLFEVLLSVGAGPLNLISQKLFFSDIAHQYPIQQQVRRQVYTEQGWPLNEELATAYLQQPPIVAGRCVELQAHIILASDFEPMSIRSVDNLPGLATGSVVDFRGLRHVHFRNLTGESDDFATQAATMFARAQDSLKDLGVSFHDVVRTWIYLSDLKGDYNTFNPVRTEFFKDTGLLRIPASTGIQGGDLSH
jgi:hypothetical protein